MPAGDLNQPGRHQDGDQHQPGTTVRHGGPPRLQAAIVLDEMLEPHTDIRLQPTPLPNTNSLFTCYFMRSMVLSFTSYGFSAAPPRSRKKSSPAASACSPTRASTKPVLRSAARRARRQAETGPEPPPSAARSCPRHRRRLVLRSGASKTTRRRPRSPSRSRRH